MVETERSEVITDVGRIVSILSFEHPGSWKGFKIPESIERTWIEKGIQV